jgi:carboxymethylenebutenolidase
MHDEDVTIDTDAGPMGGFVERPAGGGPYPAVVIIQEAFGVNAHIHDVARRFAAEGYVALAPEIFHREGPGIVLPYADMEAVMGHLQKLTHEGLEQDVRAAMGWLRDQPMVKAGEVGLVGFCIGGFTAFLGACRTDPAATVAFYGGGIARARPLGKLGPLLGESGRIRAPILCFFGSDDPSISSDDVAAVTRELDRLDLSHEVVVYPGATHGFFCDQRASYNAEAAGDAWRRTLGWFGRHLRKTV